MCGVISAILLASWEVLYGLYFNSAGLFQMGKHAWQMWISHKKILLKRLLKPTQERNDDKFEKISESSS